MTIETAPVEATMEALVLLNDPAAIGYKETG
jgi:hypothetical protein